MTDKPEALRLANSLAAHSLSRHGQTQAAACLRRQHAEIEALKEELETERVRLAACGVVAMANTPETAAKFREMNPEYRSASCDDVAKAVDREMALRAERDALRAALASAMPTVGMGWIDRAEKAEAEREALLDALDALGIRPMPNQPGRWLSRRRPGLNFPSAEAAAIDAAREAGK